MWTHNATWGISTGTEEGQTRLAVVGAVMGVVAVVTVVLNLLLLAAILFHAPSRSRSFHLHIVNMCVAAILQGAGVLTLWTHYIIRGTWLHGDALCRWWLAADTMATSVSALAIIVTACDRFIYLICWRFVKEGGKYVTSFLLMFVSWLLALTLTLILTLLQTESGSGSGSGSGSESGSGSGSEDRMGVQSSGLCSWGSGGRGERMVAARLVMYALGAGLGVGLCLALVVLPCLGRGDLLPIDEDEGELAVRKKSLLGEEERKKGIPARPLEETARALRPVPIEVKENENGEEEEEEEENFPRFLFVKKTDRLEERDRWKWQVTALTTVTVAWAVLWLPSHLFVFATRLGLHWPLPLAALIAADITGYAHAALAPLLWLLHQPLRTAAAALIRCQCCHDDDDDVFDDDSVEFQDVGPYRQGEVLPATARAPAANS